MTPKPEYKIKLKILSISILQNNRCLLELISNLKYFAFLVPAFQAAGKGFKKIYTDDAVNFRLKLVYMRKDFTFKYKYKFFYSFFCLIQVHLPIIIYSELIRILQNLL